MLTPLQKAAITEARKTYGDKWPHKVLVGLQQNTLPPNLSRFNLTFRALRKALSLAQFCKLADLDC